MPPFYTFLSLPLFLGFWTALWSFSKKNLLGFDPQAQAARNLSDENWQEFLRKPMQSIYLQEFRTFVAVFWLENPRPNGWIHRKNIGKSWKINGKIMDFCSLLAEHVFSSVEPTISPMINQHFFPVLKSTEVSWTFLWVQGCKTHDVWWNQRVLGGSSDPR